jgi:SAM-dependent methyltransferase
MKDYDLADYGERIADVYDDWLQAIDPADAVGALARLAPEGPVLELGIGTGRIALPLAERGLEVHGIDASEAMLARLREKPGRARIRTTVGDFADVAVEDRYSLVFVAANTFFGVLTQGDQVRCFENVEAHLVDGGVFVIEAFVPDPEVLRQRGRLSVREVELDSVRIEASRHDPVSQTIDGQAIELREQGARFFPFRIRYAWPSELDLMARLAGLQLSERWGGWGGEPFTAASKQHVSVYERGGERRRGSSATSAAEGR